MGLTTDGQPTLNEDCLNNVNEQSAGQILRRLALGNLLRGNLVQQIRKQSPATAAASPYNLATVQTVALPDKSRAASIVRATARAGAGTPGELVSDGYTGTAPAAGHIAIAPNGQIVTLIADGWTDLDITYIPERGNVFELFLPVTTGVATIPSSYTAAGVAILLEAELVEGAVVGKKIVLVPGTAPATLQARLNVAKTQVLFNSGTDIGTRCRVKLLVGVPYADSVDGILSEPPKIPY